VTYRIGRSYIAFEWFDDELAGPRTSQRRHEVYHLRADPTEAERARGITNPGCAKLLLWRTRPANVVIECEFSFFPLKDIAGRELPAYYRAWLVPFADGWRARTVAAIAAVCPPRYNYLESGGGIAAPNPAVTPGVMPRRAGVSCGRSSGVTAWPVSRR
jgi:hypothetical protein